MRASMLLCLLFFGIIGLSAAPISLVTTVSATTTTVEPAEGEVQKRNFKTWISERAISKKIKALRAADADKSAEDLADEALIFGVVGLALGFTLILCIIALVKANKALKLLEDYPDDYPAKQKAKLAKTLAWIGLGIFIASIVLIGAYIGLIFLLAV